MASIYTFSPEVTTARAPFAGGAQAVSAGWRAANLDPAAGFHRQKPACVTRLTLAPSTMCQCIAQFLTTRR